ncbi:putative toxin-antitoxin system toxin component, PIN family [Algoriphagus chordae]|uniref:PIN domain-containing protein n=1 Tax=Algoriphagus chordae TaxID=237019 RepID=A0A2W7QMG8_9BACT|nr:putative toxin-antitoxin system toxin component, PIN family [Algoriphagus chordae]PZX49658.1 hypothetical protein LV85_03101 [Algoriphagus chordae]
MRRNREIRIVIDTNLWISFIISNRLNQLESLLLSQEVRLLFSKQLIDEIQKTIRKPKLSKYFGEDSLDQMLDAFDPFIELIDVSSRITICRDPNDDFLLELAKDGRADYLVTGDNDLLVVEKSGLTEILKISDFFEKLNEA